MKRHEDWVARLSDHFAQMDTSACDPQWGINDCALRACDAVLAITGVDLAAEFRGTYSTELGAAKLIKQYGGGLEQLAEKVFERFALEEVPVLKSQRGDLVLIDGESPALGIVDLDGWRVRTIARGYTLANCRRAWRVG